MDEQCKFCIASFIHDMIVDFRIITLENIFHISFKKLSKICQSL